MVPRTFLASLFACLLPAALAAAGTPAPLAAAGAPAPVAAPAAPAATASSCSVPADLLPAEPRLAGLKAKFAAGLPITIVAIGGASTAGAAAGDGGASSYPRALEAALRRRHPGLAITVINKGVPRQTAAQMAARFRTDVYPAAPALVIWETGAVDATHGTDIEDFAGTLQAGIDALQAHHSEVMMVDMQYNPGIASVIDFEPYLDALQQSADLDGVDVFRRYEIMKYWSDAGVFDLVGVPLGHRAQMAKEVYKCLGERLADAIDLVTR